MAEKNGKKGDAASQQKILENFQQLRLDQRNIATKMSEIESERSEHMWVEIPYDTHLPSRALNWPDIF